MKTIDLRSDTVTLPSPEMREAIYRAELGDDVNGEDPTVNRLQAMAAEKTGKEAALLVSSGTQGNLVALLSHCGRGDEVILGEWSHTYLAEVGGMAVCGGIQAHTLPHQADGGFDPVLVEQAIRAENIHNPRTRLICLENTANRMGGAILTPARHAEMRALADKHHLQIHLDGARLFNASVGLGIDVREITQHVDSVTFCLSKGLAAPVGSLLCGTKAFIQEARRQRKMLGSGMRQAGIIAAAGIVSLEKMIDRLADDHVNARKLARGLSEIPGIHLTYKDVPTNMLFFELEESAPPINVFLGALKERGVLMLSTAPGRVRAVTHYGIESADIDLALQAISAAMQAHAAPSLQANYN